MNLNNISVLFRKDSLLVEEFKVCSRYFNTVTSRMELKNQLVIGRYSVLPYYRDLEYDLKYNNNQLINTWEQHQWIANFDWYDVVKDYTFQSWREEEFPRSNYDGPLVVKGCTNSRKHKWDTDMFARNRREAVLIGCKLKDDPLISQQKLIYRKYEPLVTHEIGLNGVRYTEEYRFFFYQGGSLEMGFYWSDAEIADSKQETPYDCYNFALKIAQIVKKYVNFFVLDIVQKEDGEWMLCEINDGQMSGLSMCDPATLYENLGKALGIVY